MRERSRKIAANPEGRRQWDELKASALRTRESEHLPLACLRMVSAAFGTEVEESTLESQSSLDEDGTTIAELERLARHFGLIGEIHEASTEQLRQFLADGKLAMAYIDRAVYDLPPRRRASHSLRADKIYVVVPAPSPPRQLSITILGHRHVSSAGPFAYFGRPTNMSGAIASSAPGRTMRATDRCAKN